MIWIEQSGFQALEQSERSSERERIAFEHEDVEQPRRAVQREMLSVERDEPGPEVGTGLDIMLKEVAIPACVG